MGQWQCFYYKIVDQSPTDAPTDQCFFFVVVVGVGVIVPPCINQLFKEIGDRRTDGPTEIGIGGGRGEE